MAIHLLLYGKYYYGCNYYGRTTMAALLWRNVLWRNVLWRVLWLYYYGCTTTMVGARHRLRDLAAARRDLAGDALLAPAAGRLVT